MPARMTPTRFDKGVTNASVSGPYAFYGAPVRAKYHSYFDDFDNYRAAEWLITSVGASTIAVQFVDGGAVRLTNAAADDDSTFLQYSGDDFAGANRTWTFELGKQLWFSSRFRLSDAVDSDAIMGLQIADTTPLAVSDGVFFRKNDDSATMTFVSCVGSVETVHANVGTVVSGVDATWAFYFDGLGSFHIYKDAVKTGVLTPTSFSAVTMTTSFGVQNGAAVAKFMQVDFLACDKERPNIV